MNIGFYLNTANKTGAGLYFAVYPLSNQLEFKGYNINIHSLNIKDGKDLDVWGANLHKSSKITSFYKMMDNHNDIIHVHGLWNAHSLAASLVSKKKKCIVSPHGMLDQWALNQSKYKKYLAKILYENRLWSNASYIHALNNKEADAIRNILPNSRIEIIPNGIDIPKISCNKQEKIKILFLGRLHEKKGIKELISWYLNIPCSIKDKFELHVAGSGDYENEILDISNSNTNFFYHGSVYGKDKESLYQSCNIFVLPSYSEGLPMTVLEAWSYGLITFISKACNLEQSYDYDFSYNLEPSATSLTNNLNFILSLSLLDIYILGQEAREYVIKNYAWDIIANKHDECYRSVAE
ncbi:TPA: glycosyltransferase [Photobacterium damselae]